MQINKVKYHGLQSPITLKKTIIFGYMKKTLYLCRAFSMSNLKNRTFFGPKTV